MYKFSAPFTNPIGSPIRELFKYLSEPGMISFAGGYPASDLFDVEGLGVAAEAAYARSNVCLQYGPTDGIPELRDELVRLMACRGAKVAGPELLVTTGSQQGLDLLLRVLLEPGDSVVVEQPAYPATLQALKLQRAKVRAVGIDRDGLDVDALEELLSTLPKTERPKFLYTVPNFANPTGATLSKQRRLRLLEIATRYELFIVEDDPYGDLRFAGEPIPSLLAMTEDVPGSKNWVVHFSSLSKVVAPGLRVGWTVAPLEVTRRCTIAKQTADLCSTPWTQLTAAKYLQSGRLPGHLNFISDAYKAKCDALCNELQGLLDGRIEFLRPEGGMFVWARLISGIDASELLKRAIDRSVIFVPGVAFFASDAELSSLRLSFAAPSVADIKEGVNRLTAAFADISR
ncbi:MULTISPECIES: PLP-dependent aminotransferase family protein [Caballeronia]|uniref:aminotransferase-like domain-containing protein n=1 Tax=Caballeronia TaxID=1827195 RepID=UPI001FD3BE64|nr:MULTISPECIES: PLP-dependent aminotransferase family protein [Caballeronia]MDR5799189.1 PLP-dependent aminotransferase family protein [Caballeronia sp. LZ001]